MSLAEVPAWPYDLSKLSLGESAQGLFTTVNCATLNPFRAREMGVVVRFCSVCVDED